MSAEVAIREQPRQLTALSTDQLQFIANTEFVPPGLRGNIPAILACVATGRALGISDMSALRSIHIIDGKASLSAELMVSLVRLAGHSITGSTADGVATVIGKRADNGDTITVEWTLAMAERAGLMSKQNWRKYPEAMLWARAVSQLARMLFADCFAGATYVPEELEESAGEPAAERMPATVSQAVVSDEPASPADEIAAEVFGDDIAPASEDDKTTPTAKQIKYLNATVGPMSQEDKHRVWATIALLRVRAKDELILELGGVYDDALHWSPLRDTLTKAEASSLIDRLEAHAKEQA